MIVLLALMGFVLYLAVIFIVGWYLVAPAVEWVCGKILALSIKGHDYRAMVKAEKESGEVQQQST